MHELVAPVVLFAYVRPDMLEQALLSLRNNDTSQLYVFSDGPSSAAHEQDVQRVRKLLRSISWCNCTVVERTENLGLGKSIMHGVREVLKRHDRVIVYEDDLVCVPGAIHYLSAALAVYQDDQRVMSVTGWTHPDLTPDRNVDQPYFDGRSSSWLWGCWRRSWRGMRWSARQMIWTCRLRGIDPRAYGCDLYRLANYEKSGNTWAVRFMYNHIRTRSLSMHPPWSLVEHVGLGEGASHITAEKEEKWKKKWGNPTLRECPPIPAKWPDPFEPVGQKEKWQDKCGRYQPTARWFSSGVG